MSWRLSHGRIEFYWFAPIQFLYPILSLIHIINPSQHGFSELLIYHLLINPLSNGVVGNKKEKAGCNVGQ